jgi:hypothetical protein
MKGDVVTLLEAGTPCNMKMSSCMEALVSSWVARFGGLSILRPRPAVHLCLVGRGIQRDVIYLC